jgi:UDP-N-acetylbacillosamine N-acetyltransferase
MKTIGIYGAGGHGRVVASVARALGYTTVFIDDAPQCEALKLEAFVAHYPDAPVALGIGDNSIRRAVYERCKMMGLTMATLVHPSAIVAEDVVLGEGTVVMPRAAVNVGTRTGRGAVLNTGCIVEHDGRICDFAHIAPAAACAGEVHIGEGTLLGIGSCVVQQRTIGDDVLIGAGSVVVDDIPSRVIAYGNPCRIRKDK